MRAMIVAAVLAALPAHAEAQNCMRGCRCGNTCIDCSDTCHSGGGGSSSGGDADAGVLVPVLLVGLGLTALGLGIYAIGEYASAAPWATGDAGGLVILGRW